MNNREKIEVLRKAREVLNAGWTQGEFGDGAGSFCMLGAIRHAVGADKRGVFSVDNFQKPYGAYTQLLPEVRAATPGHDVPEFNDEPTRTKEECLAVFDKAITKLEKQEVLRLLTEARDKIQTGGWCRGAYKKHLRGKECYCTTGACFEVAGNLDKAGRTIKPDDGITGAVFSHLVAALVGKPSFGSPWSTLVRWNDADSRSKVHVIRLFNRAIKTVAKELES